MSETSTLGRTLETAADVAKVLADHQVDTIVIGALALAVHGYPRDTVDLDLAVAVEPRRLHSFAELLRARGFDVTVRDPDGDDPLGGVIDVVASGADLVQIVNFLNPPASGFPRLVTDSLADARELVPGGILRVVDPYHLIASKLYAGGAKSKLDILELLDRNEEIELPRLRSLCESYNLHRELEQVLGLAEEIR